MPPVGAACSRTIFKADNMNPWDSVKLSNMPNAIFTAGGESMAAHPFIGTWQLVSWERRAPDGEVTYPYGGDAAGFLTYTADGYMFVVLTKASRSPFASADVSGGSAAEKVAAMESYFSYCGRYELQSLPGTAEIKTIHHILACSFPNWTGTDQVRFAEISLGYQGDRLLLRTQPIFENGKLRISHLIWQRLR